MSPETIDLDTALKLFSLPRTVGVDPETEAPITAQNGRYGPYLKKGTDSRTLPNEQLLFDIDLGIQSLRPRVGDQDPALVALTGAYHNLLRQWAQP